jgi:hypothetical protein
MLTDICLNEVCFSIGNESKEIPVADVGTSGPSRWTTRIHNGWRLQIIPIFARNFQYLKRRLQIVPIFVRNFQYIKRLCAD